MNKKKIKFNKFIMDDEIKKLKEELAEAKNTIKELSNRIIILEEQIKTLKKEDNKSNPSKVSFKNTLNLK